jgi:hypothetical protein
MKTDIKNMGIQQLSIAYDVTEDRLLFKIGLSNDTEISIWLTRRLSQSLTTLLNKTPLLTHYDAPKNEEPEFVSKNSDNESAAKKMNFLTEHHVKTPLQIEEILLAQRCQLLNIKGSQPTTLELLCLNNQSLKFKLNDELIMAFMNMLQHANQQANWNFSTPSSPKIPILSHTSYSLH